MAQDTAPGPVTDWARWLERWDAQQTGYLPDREARFGVMLDALEVLLPPGFAALDLCSGPGSISQRLLARFPGATCVAVDKDPLLLALGEGALGTLGGRLRWVDADVAVPGWPERVAPGADTEPQLDAVLSTTALHWLAPDRLVAVYRDLGRLLRPDGVFLNGDNMVFPPHAESFRRVGRALRERARVEAQERRGVESWDGWWAALREEPGLAPLLAERERRFASRDRSWANTGLALQRGALQDAGFREVGVLWQHGDNRVLMAVR